jgi:hypothetical protein
MQLNMENNWQADDKMGLLIEKWRERNKAFSTEGRKGVINLCRLVNVLGYNDPLYFGQMAPDASIGDLICFLEDNPGAIEALINFIGDSGIAWWQESLQDELGDEEEND